MSFEKITENVENISLLADTPAMTPAELKAEFDKGNKTIKTKFNKLVDDLNAIAPFEGENLYSDNAGTTETVPLSKDISSMKRLRIKGHSINSNHEVYFTQEISVELNKDISLLFNGYVGAQYNYINKEIIQLTSTSITRGTQQRIGFSNTIGEGKTTNVDNTSIYITEVIGFNY